MKILFNFIWVILGLSATAQKKEKLYFFSGKDSLVGVKTESGKIIIPAKHIGYDFYDFSTPITGDLINLWLPKDTAKFKNTFGVYYSTDGKYLCRPYSFDNGPDYLSEGFFRFVDQNKMGFANRFGEIKIKANHDFVASFSLGTAMYCDGCYFDTKKDPEHPPLVGGVYGFMNYKGETLQNNIAFANPKKFWAQLDSIRQKLYPLQFQNTSAEANLLKKLLPYQSAIEKKYFENYAGEGLKKSLEFQITEKPTPQFPYYVVNSFEKTGKEIIADPWNKLEFYISKDGKNVFCKDAFDGKVPFAKWFKEYTAAVKK